MILLHCIISTHDAVSELSELHSRCPRVKQKADIFIGSACSSFAVEIAARLPFPSLAIQCTIQGAPSAGYWVLNASSVEEGSMIRMPVTVACHRLIDCRGAWAKPVIPCHTMRLMTGSFVRPTLLYYNTALCDRV